jgi:hypothetical protein
MLKKSAAAATRIRRYTNPFFVHPEFTTTSQSDLSRLDSPYSSHLL